MKDEGNQIFLHIKYRLDFDLIRYKLYVSGYIFL